MMEEVEIGGGGRGGEEGEGETLVVTDDEDFQPPAERWAPIGSATPTPHEQPRESESVEMHRLKELENEQEQLNSSLLALTTHFAQVQFRLQQIGKAGTDDRERLLKELEDFAFRGCPDISDVKGSRSWHSNDPGVSTAEHEAIMEKQRAKQLQLIGQLKDQLMDLERFAYESGDAGLPSNEVMEKQRVIIDQLKERMELDIVDKFDALTTEDLQMEVDAALKRLINPMKVKEQLVQQLQTQITDLERFIEFLQGEGGISATCTCQENNAESKDNCRLHGRFARMMEGGGAKGFGPHQKHRDNSSNTMAMLQLYILSHLGCQSQKFHKNQLKKSAKGNHWGDLRAALELAVEKVVDVAEKHQEDERPATLNPYNSDEEDVDDVFDQCHEEVVTAVRKEFCPALRDLLQHGMVDPNSQMTSSALSAFGCLPARSRQITASSAPGNVPTPAANNVVKLPPHAWDILVQYYEMKHGRDYSDAPVRKLTQSFNLDNIGGRAVTSKQMLLSTIDNVATTHTKLRRSQDAMFKAFVSAALNHKKLVPWLRMILRVREIVDDNFEHWSYVSRTGFDDALTVVERLNAFTFSLPVDLAVRPFQHIKDAF